MTGKPFYDEDMARQQEQLAATTDMKVQRELMLELLSPSSGEHVLDVGSGNGFFAREVAAKVGDSGRVVGIDSSAPMIDMAKALCPTAEFLEGDATDLPVIDECFDAVTASQVLCFVADVDAAIKEMRRVLKPGGRLAVLDSDWGSLAWNCRDRELMGRAIRLLTGPYADAHVPRTLSRRLTANGFRIIDRRAHTILNFSADPDSYSQQTVSYIQKMMEASEDFSADDWEDWITDQTETERRGEYFFSLNRYVFSAVKR